LNQLNLRRRYTWNNFHWYSHRSTRRFWSFTLHRPMFNWLEWWQQLKSNIFDFISLKRLRYKAALMNFTEFPLAYYSLNKTFAFNSQETFPRQRINPN
jgi:hypothetical protein